MSGMSQEDAQRLFHNGGTLVFLDVPKGTEFGIDYNHWVVGPNFKGVKMIPPGVHFVYYSAVNDAQQSAPRTGFFYNFKAQEVLLKKWDKRMEDIKTEVINPEEQQNVEENKKDMDRFLGAYPYEHYQKWVSLTDNITPSLLDRLQPKSGQISSVAQFQSERSTSQSRKEAAEAQKNLEENPGSSTSEEIAETALLDKDGLPNMKALPGTEIRFSKVPDKKYPEGASASEISKYSMDYSYVLDLVVRENHGGDANGLIGELQYAFICFLMGQVYDAFEQWKLLVNLFCNCDAALVEKSELFSKFIGVLYYHVKEIPEDFFVDIVAQNNFLVGNLRSFFVNVQESNVKEELKSKAVKFQKHLEKKFGWDFSGDDWDEEDGPVVVELP